MSPLGQPLNAEIEIVALRPGEEEGLVAKIAPLDAFNAAGIEPGAVLNTMKFEVQRRGNQRILKLITTAPVNDPFVEVLVELQWATGKLVREYTFLLDPPEYKSPQTIAAMQPPAPPAAPVAKPVPAPVEVLKPAPAVEAKPAEPAAPAPAVIAPVPDTPAAATPATPEPAKPQPAEAPRAEAQPSSPVTAVPIAPAPAESPAPAPAAAPAPEAAKPAPAAALAGPTVYEVQKGDTLAGIAKANLPPGVTLNQMLIAIYRANQDAFIRENINLVRAGRILNIPTADDLGTVDAAEANRVVRAHMSEFREYRSRLAAVPTTVETAPAPREAAGSIEPKPATPGKPAAPQDQVRLSKADPQKPGASQAARGDDQVARERALKEAQSRVSDLEKNVADLQKLLELKNRQLAELEKKAAGAKPAPEAPKPVPAAPAPVAKAPEAPKPAAPAPAAPAPAAKAPEKPAAEAPKPAPAAPVTPAAPAPAAKAPEAPKPAPKAATPPPPPPEKSLVDEILDEPTYIGALGAIVLLLVGYFVYAWRKKKAAQAKFHDSVMGAAAAGAAAGATGAEPTLGAASAPSGAPTQPPASGAPAGMAAEEVDPIAEADVYMAYGRDAQAEEILKEALQKDGSRLAVHLKLLEIYANRKDAKAFEQSALKVKNLTKGTGPDWDKAAGLGRSVDPQNGLYGTGEPAAAPAPAAAAAAPAPTLDFDVGGGAQASASAPDLTLDAAPKTADAGLDFDISGAPAKADASADETVVVPSIAAKDAGGGMDFNLDLGSPAESPAAPAAPAAAASPDVGLSFDLNLDLGGADKDKTQALPAAPDLSTISLDLGSSGAAPAPSGADPKWQEVATKLDLAKAYEEMGDKNGARDLLNEVMKDGDAAQKGQAQQLLAKLG